LPPGIVVPDSVVSGLRVRIGRVGGGL